jgi:hypothetical protein
MEHYWNLVAPTNLDGVIFVDSQEKSQITLKLGRLAVWLWRVATRFPVEFEHGH